MNYKNILAYVAIGCLLVGDRVSAYFNRTYGNYSFILSNVSADHSQGGTALIYAQNWCRSNGYTLATIPNEKVESYVKHFINNGSIVTSDQIIMNGKLYTSLNGTWIWVNGQQISAGVDIHAQPNPNPSNFYGFLKTSDYKIYASNHNNERPFICEKPGNANDCEGGLPFNGRCYQRNTSSLTWYSARNECVRGGGDLASFAFPSDGSFNSTLGSALFEDASLTEYWVGMQRVEWRWEDTAAMPISSTNSSDAPQTKSTTASPIPSLSFSTSPVQPTSMLAISSKNASLGLPLGLGIGLGVGAILGVAIVLGVIFIRRRQKSKSSPYSENTSSSDATVRNGFKESDVDEDHKELKTNGIKKYDASTGNANQGGAIYAAIQPNGTPTIDTDKHKTPIVYAPLDLIQNP